MDKNRLEQLKNEVLKKLPPLLKRREVLAGIAVVTGLLLLGSGGLKDSGQIPEDSVKQVSETPADSRLLQVKTSLEQNMAQTLSLIRGVGDVTVSLNISSSIETVYETEITQDKSYTDETSADGTTRRTESGGLVNTPAVIRVNGDESALVSLETGPEILGAVVVAEGVWDNGVKEEVFEAVKVMTGLPAHKIVVLDRKDG